MILRFRLAEGNTFVTTAFSFLPLNFHIIIAVEEGIEKAGGNTTLHFHWSDFMESVVMYICMEGWMDRIRIPKA